MKHHLNFQPATFDDLEPGSCFAFEIRDQTHIGIKIKGGTTDPKALIAVYPGHPDLNGKPGLLLASALRHKPLAEYCNAEAVVSGSPKNVHCGLNVTGLPIGTLFLVNNELVLVASSDDGSLCVQLSDGEPRDIEDTHRLLWFSEWEIGQRIDGRWDTICSMSIG